MQYALFALILCLWSCSSSEELGADAGANRVEGAGLNPTSSAPAPAPLSFRDTIAGIPTALYLRGRFDPAVNDSFVPVADRYTDGDPYLLHYDTYGAFERMHAAARAEGVTLLMVSATRNFDRQKQIWEAKWNGRRLLEGKEKANEVYPDAADRARAILRYSSMPGTSRHHWGTDIDLNALNNGYFEAGEGKRVYDWLTANAARYGFCQPYTEKGPDRLTGYEEERWHWSYLPLATQLTDYARGRMKNEEIGGFDGAEAAGQINVITNYVLGINSACL